MLLVPKVVVEYHKLSKDVVKESLGVEATDSFDPTQRLQKDSPMKDTGKMGEKLQETMSSMMVGLHPLARPSRLRWKNKVDQVTPSPNPTLLKSHWNIKTTVGQMWS
ncbi:MgPa adhesin [Mycoplasmoides genitalium M6320]|uniref:MgPa adhesin n=1 Tax=Mycoplasmoides genitalium M6320 TaxID=662945 RepID=A0ABC7ZJB8_MYCGT|nr:MgPa adhesin [Mycoplasmoides genitalium M6320]